MSPEFGSTCAYFPIDDEHPALSLASPADQTLASALVEAYAKEQGLWHDPDHQPLYSGDWPNSTSAPSSPHSPDPRRPSGPSPARQRPARLSVEIPPIVLGSLTVDDDTVALPGWMRPPWSPSRPAIPQPSTPRRGRRRWIARSRPSRELPIAHSPGVDQAIPSTSCSTVRHTSQSITAPSQSLLSLPAPTPPTPR